MNTESAGRFSSSNLTLTSCLSSKNFFKNGWASIFSYLLKFFCSFLSLILSVSAYKVLKADLMGSSNRSVVPLRSSLKKYEASKGLNFLLSVFCYYNIIKKIETYFIWFFFRSTSSSSTSITSIMLLFRVGVKSRIT